MKATITNIRIVRGEFDEMVCCHPKCPNLDSRRGHHCHLFMEALETTADEGGNHPEPLEACDDVARREKPFDNPNWPEGT